MAEVDERGFAAQADFLQVANQRRDGSNLGFDGTDLLRQHAVDLVKIRLELGQLIAGADLRGGNAKIKINVRIHARQQLLQDEKAGIVAAVECQHPASGRGPACLKSGQRVEVSRREDDIELLHQGTVLEAAAG